jgi:antitoxin Phd
MSNWQLQTAKQKLSELVDRAVSEGPQTITRHGQEVAVVLGIEDYHRLGGEMRPSLRDVLLRHVGIGGDIDLEREIPRRARWRGRPAPSLGE